MKRCFIVALLLTAIGICPVYANNAISFYPMHKATGIMKRFQMDKDLYYGINGIALLPITYSFALKNAKKYYLVRGLSDPSGHVQIANADDALAYVRLQTSYTCHLAPDFEVIDRPHVFLIPNYGLPQLNIDLDVKTTPPGWYGVISSQAFKKGGFSLPKVIATTRGYIITRWLFYDQNFNRHHRIRKVEETVSAIGEYHCKILLDRPAPKLRGADWYVPYQE